LYSAANEFWPLSANLASIDEMSDEIFRWNIKNFDFKHGSAAAK
jgi:hypothetical protein